MQKILLMQLITLLFFGANNIYSQPNHYVDKKAGICFRIDDNKNISNYNEYAEIFNNHDLNFTFALNLAKEQITTDYISMVKDLQARGHEMMDHTPHHRTNYFYTNLGTEYYIDHLGVRRISGTKVELEHMNVNLNDAVRTGNVNISGNSIENIDGIFSNFSKSECYLYFPSLNKLVFIEDWVNDNTVTVRDIWRNGINLGYHENIKFYNFDFSNVHLTIDALKALAEETLRLADHYGIERPKTWIQPGGYFPRAHKDELKSALGDQLDFVAGAVYPSKSLTVFNEYNPNSDKAFGMQWGDFYDDTWTLEKIKNVIADKIAKNKVLIGHSHFNGLLDGWDGYLDRVDNILEWCIENDIPVRTYAEWADILYNQTPNPYQNIFPKLYVDNDENNYPDGYSQTIKTKEEYIDFEGVWINTEGVEESLNHSFAINKVGNICYVGKKNWWEVDGLAGLEKGENYFEIWTKGALGNFIEVVFKIGSSEYIYKFPADSPEWQKYDLSNSINGNKSLIIPENTSLIDILIRCSDYKSGNVMISGMNLHKKIEEYEFYLNLSVLLEGAYLNENQMSTFINEHLPKIQPFNKLPWNYNGDENIIEIPNKNIVDWVLVSLYSDINDENSIARKAGFLLNNGKIVDIDGTSSLGFNIIPGSYFVKVEHRNHLPIISSSTIILSK